MVELVDTSDSKSDKDNLLQVQILFRISFLILNKDYSFIKFIMIIIVLGIVLCVAYLTLLERKLMGSMQRRIGPNKVGYLGLLQPIADGVKLILKESIFGLESNKILFVLAPFITFYLALANWLFIPLDVNLSYSDIQGAGILLLIAITELGIFGVLYAGWAANSKYSLIGSLRSTAQMISYSIT